MTQHPSITLKSRPPFGEREKQAFVDIDYAVVEEPSGPLGVKHVEFHRDQRLAGYHLELAERHGIAIRWR